MSEPEWPTLTFDIPEDSSEHARYLQNDFDAVHQFLKSDRTKQAPRFMFNILYRSYSELHAKLQSAPENYASRSGIVLSTQDCNKMKTVGPLSFNSNDKGGHSHRFVQRLGGGKEWADQDDVQRAALGSRALMAPDEELRDQRLQNCATARNMQAQFTATHGEGPSTVVGSDVIGHTLDMDLRHSVVTHMHKSTFYVTLEVNPAVIHNKGLRDQLIQYYAELKDSVRCLAVYDALNADRDIKKSYVQGLCVCHTEVTDKGSLVVFVRSPDMLPPLVTARSWRRNLVVKAFPKLQIQRSNKYLVDSYNSATNSTDSLRIVGNCYKTSWEERDLVGLRTPPDIVVQVPRANAKDHLNSLKPRGVVNVVQKALGANPGYDKNWALGATVGASGNIVIPLTNGQALKALLLDKSWQVDLRRRLALGRQAYRIQLMGAVLNHTDVDTKYGRSRIARTLVNENYNGKLDRRDIQNVDWYSEKLTAQHGSVVVTFARAGAANLALKGGLRWQSTLHECLRLPDDEFVEQCYKCQAYEYNEAECLGDLHCAYCAMDHCTLDCKETFRKCVLCGGGHASIDPVCPLRATRESEAKQQISLKAPFESREPSRRYIQATILEKQDATTSLLRDSVLKPVPNNSNPTPSQDTRLSIKEGTSLNKFPDSSNDPQESSLKRTAPGPFGSIDGNGRSTPSAKRVKREGAEQDIGAGEDPIQKYNGENGAIPWPPPRDQRTMGVTAGVSWENQVQQKKSRNANRKAANRRWKRGKQRS